jgi:peptidoglycan/xylan/chitin deacetylase (PgdA/CDA1 family)
LLVPLPDNLLDHVGPFSFPQATVPVCSARAGSSGPAAAGAPAHGNDAGQGFDAAMTIRRAIRTSLLVATLLVVTGVAVVWTAPDWLAPWLARRYPGCLYQVETQQKVVALTIDDGPDPESTPKILDQLRRQGARATFFVITDRIPGQWSLMGRVVREGHQLGNHFTRDRASARLSLREFEADLVAAHRALSPWSHPVWARPGSGWYTEDMIRVLRQHQYRCALGSVYPLDAVIPSASWTSHYILRHVRPGSIVILHDGGKRGQRTARVLAAVLPELGRRGYRVVTLSELMRVRDS